MILECSGDLFGPTSGRPVDEILSTRSVGMNLARPFKAGKGQTRARRVATADRRLNRRYATGPDK